MGMRVGSASRQVVQPLLAVFVVLSVPHVATAQLGAGGQTIGGPGVVGLNETKSNAGESMATVLVSENRLSACATVRPIKGIVTGIYLGAGDQDAHFDTAPTGEVVSRTDTVCRPSVAWVSIHCRVACAFEWRVDQFR